MGASAKRRPNFLNSSRLSAARHLCCAASSDAAGPELPVVRCRIVLARRGSLITHYSACRAHRHYRWSPVGNLGRAIGLSAKAWIDSRVELQNRRRVPLNQLGSVFPVNTTEALLAVLKTIFAGATTNCARRTTHRPHGQLRAPGRKVSSIRSITGLMARLWRAG